MTSPSTVEVSSSSRGEMMDRIDGQVRLQRPSALYVAALGVVAVAMIILPLLYIALIGLVGYGIFYHAYYDYSLFRLGWHVGLCGYIAPIVVGLILLGFMVKPLLTRNRRGDRALVIDEHNEPAFAAYIHRLCEAMGTPRPDAVKVDCDVNASAALRFGVTGRRLTLTVGLPLMTTLSVREFSGVMAHEFGHFAQSTAMVLSYTIRAINRWFARLVYERDLLDAMMVEGSHLDDRFDLVLLVVHLFVWTTRKILWLLMMVGHAISCFVSRQMEFDADRAEAMVAGSQASVALVTKLRILSAGAHAAYGHLHASWQDRKLVDDLPALIAQQAHDVPKSVRDEIEKHIAETPTTWLETHPSDRSRIQRVENMAAPGIVHDDGPAHGLLQSFGAICKAATLIHYREVIGPGVSADNLMDTSRLLRRHAQQGAERKALEKYLGHGLYVSRPVFLEPDAVGHRQDLPAALDTLKESFATISAARPQIVSAYERHIEADDALAKAKLASSFLRCGIRFDAADFKMEECSLEAVGKMCNAALLQRAEATDFLVTYETVLRKRMSAALQLLASDKVATRLKRADVVAKDARRMLGVLQRLRDAFGRFDELRSLRLTVTAAAHLGDVGGKIFGTVIVPQLEEALSIVRDGRMAVIDVPYPFDHAHGKIPVSEYLLEYVPGMSDPSAAYSAVVEYIDNLSVLYFRVMGRLAFIAAKVERIVGLPAFAEDSARAERSERLRST